MTRRSRIDLSWTAPADDGGADILLYCIVAANPGGTLTDLALIANANECQIQNAATTDDDIETLTGTLTDAAGAANDVEVVIIIAATDDDGQGRHLVRAPQARNPGRYQVAVPDLRGQLQVWQVGDDQ